MTIDEARKIAAILSDASDCVVAAWIAERLREAFPEITWTLNDDYDSYGDDNYPPLVVVAETGA